MSTYSFIRNQNWYYRRRIPKEFHKFFSKKYEICISMSTKSQIRATIKAKKLNMLYEEMMMALQLDTFEKKEQIVDQYMSVMKDTLKENYFTFGKLTSSDGTVTSTDLEYEQIQCKRSLQQEISHIAPSQIEDVLTSANIDVNSVDDKTYRQLDRLYLSKKIDMLQELIQTINPQTVNSSSTQITDSKTETGISFKALYELFLKEKSIDSDLCKTTYRDYESAYNDFIYVIPDAQNRDIATFTKKDFQVFTNAIHNLPSSRTKKPEYRNIPYSILETMDIPEDAKMATNTKKKKLSSIKQIFDIAIDPRYSYLEENFSEAFILKGSKKGKNSAKIKRTPLSDENLEKLFNSKIYTSNLQKSITKEPQKYWIPVIALYSGLRQNEICQLYIEDIKQEIIKTDSDETIIHYFDINDNDDKHLKNINATRRVPIHPKLIELGFLNYYEKVKKSSNRLFPQLRFHPTEERYNSDYNKTFMKYFRQYITTDATQVFHSLRHNTGDQLLNNAVKHRLPKDLMNAIMGHEPDQDETTATYSQGYGIEQLYEGLKTLKYDINIAKFHY